MNFRFLLASIVLQITSAGQEPPPIACNLKALTAAQRKELSHITGHFVDAIAGSRELPDGYSFRVDPARATLVEVANLLTLWRLCCPFYEFRIDFHGADGAMWLSITGRPGVKQYLPIDSPSLATKLPK